MAQGSDGLGIAPLGGAFLLGEDPGVFLTAELVESPTRVALAAIRGGSITGISIQLSEPRTAGSLTARATINGVPSLLFVTLDTATDVAVETQDIDVDSFDAGDELGVELEVSEDWEPVTAEGTFMLEVETARSLILGS